MDGSTQVSRSGEAPKVMRWGALLILVISSFATVAWTDDVLKIGSLLTYPESYNAKIVRVAGVVTDYRMDHGIGSLSHLEKCLQYFRINDGTGTVNATYATICPRGAVFLKNGDRVIVEAYVSSTPGAAGLNVKSVRKF